MSGPPEDATLRLPAGPVPPPRPAAVPEDVLARFPAVELLGQGTTAVVYRGRQPGLERDVVVKVLLNPDPELRARFVVEARTLAGFRHPAIVKILDHGESGGRLYMTYAYQPGRALEDLLKERGRFTWPDVLRFAVPALEGLGVAHARGVIHRDVKPANILVRPDGSGVLLDFGFSSVPDSRLTATGEYLGTPAYSAPELLLGQRCGPASDLYALGLTMLTALAGANPFQATTLLETMKRQADLSPASVVDGLDAPPELKRTLTLLLAKDPAERPASAPALARRLAALASARGRRPAAGPVLAGAAGWRRLAFAAASILSVAGALDLALVRREPRAPAPPRASTAAALPSARVPEPARLPALSRLEGEADALIARAWAAPPAERERVLAGALARAPWAGWLATVRDAPPDAAPADRLALANAAVAMDAVRRFGLTLAPPVRLPRLAPRADLEEPVPAGEAVPLTASKLLMLVLAPDPLVALGEPVHPRERFTVATHRRPLHLVLHVNQSHPAAYALLTLTATRGPGRLPLVQRICLDRGAEDPRENRDLSFRLPDAFRTCEDISIELEARRFPTAARRGRVYCGPGRLIRLD